MRRHNYDVEQKIAGSVVVIATPCVRRKYAYIFVGVCDSGEGVVAHVFARRKYAYIIVSGKWGEGAYTYDGQSTSRQNPVQTPVAKIF